MQRLLPARPRVPGTETQSSIASRKDGGWDAVHCRSGQHVACDFLLVPLDRRPLLCGLAEGTETSRPRGIRPASRQGLREKPDDPSACAHLIGRTSLIRSWLLSGASCSGRPGDGCRGVFGWCKFHSVLPWKMFGLWWCCFCRWHHSPSSNSCRVCLILGRCRLALMAGPKYPPAPRTATEPLTIAGNEIVTGHSAAPQLPGREGTSLQRCPRCHFTRTNTGVLRATLEC